VPSIEPCLYTELRRPPRALCLRRVARWLTNRTFSKLLGKVLKRPAFFPAPKFAVTAMRGSEVADFVTASLRVMPRRALDKGYTFRFPELEPALRDLLGK
jgi:uncharacterized protein